MSDFNLFKGRDLFIATKHKKEIVIAPLLEKALGVRCYTKPDFDTDIFGTFTGEIERKDDPLTTVRNKCTEAFKVTNCDLIVASEGSFFPHPSFYLAHCNVEILYLMDIKNDLDIAVHEQSNETNFNGQTVNSIKELYLFCQKVGFPSHGLILRRSKNGYFESIKGIQRFEQLTLYANYFFSTYGEVYVETDMRAMYNPTRMKVIEKATKSLLDKIASCCPICSTPGYGVTNILSGLPCEICGLPTQSTKSWVYACKKCSFGHTVDFPNGKEKEDAMYCDFCNP